MRQCQLPLLQATAQLLRHAPKWRRVSRRVEEAALPAKEPIHDTAVDAMRRHSRRHYLLVAASGVSMMVVITERIWYNLDVIYYYERTYDDQGRSTAAGEYHCGVSS